MNLEAVKDLLYRLADDDLIMGHRHSEWTGLGPILEEDIAFSSMAQDEIGHAQAYYMILHESLGEKDPDTLGFSRKAEDFKNSILVEWPNQDYAFSLVRQWLYDTAEAVRLENLAHSRFTPLADLAKKLAKEEKYHQFHALTWIKQLGKANEDANGRLQKALNQAYPMALGLFEPGKWEESLVNEGIMANEAVIQKAWENLIRQVAADANLSVPTVANPTEFFGGRLGKHTEHLQPLLTEMTEVYTLDPAATW